MSAREQASPRDPARGPTTHNGQDGTARTANPRSVTRAGHNGQAGYSPSQTFLGPHPGDAYYLEAVAKRLTDRTRVLGFTHLTSTVGDLMPAREPFSTSP